MRVKRITLYCGAGEFCASLIVLCGVLNAVLS